MNSSAKVIGIGFLLIINIWGWVCLFLPKHVCRFSIWYWQKDEKYWLARKLPFQKFLKQQNQRRIEYLKTPDALFQARLMGLGLVPATTAFIYVLAVSN